MCRDHGTTLPAAAVAFPLRHPAVVDVTLGMRDVAQVRRNVALHREGVPEQLWEDLQDQGLLARTSWGQDA